jgi:hypothetical protein
MTGHRPPLWTDEEREREERVREIRTRRDREMTPEERLQETLRLSLRTMRRPAAREHDLMDLRELGG